MERNLKISNAKGILIFLVVFGHFLEIYTFDHYELFISIYAFHMPLFIFLNGYLTRRMNFKKILNLVLLYLLFQTFFKWFVYIIGQEPLLFKYKNPYYHLWYLVSMVYWYVLSWILIKLDLKRNAKVIFFFSILLIVFFARLDDGNILRFFKRFDGDLYLYSYSYLRSVSYLPFFLSGFFMTETHFNKISNLFKNKLFVLISIAATCFLVVILFHHTFGVEAIIKGRYDITAFVPEDASVWVGILKLIIYYILAFWLCLLVMNIVTNEKSFLTQWGDQSLPIYLFHPIIPILLRETSLVLGWSGDTKRLFYFVLALLTTSFLSSNLFTKTTRFICRPVDTIEFIIKRIKLIK